MKELERQRVIRIALDHALQMQEAEKAPPTKTRSLYIKALAAGVAATAAIGAATAAGYFP